MGADDVRYPSWTRSSPSGLPRPATAKVHCVADADWLITFVQEYVTVARDDHRMFAEAFAAAKSPARTPPSGSENVSACTSTLTGPPQAT